MKKVIVHAKTPCTIAVNGVWGVGKTRFLQLLKCSLEEDDHLVIWFDLWKYEATGNVLFALASHVVESTNTRESSGKFLRFAAGLGKSLVTVAGLVTGNDKLAEKGNEVVENIVGLQTESRSLQQIEAEDTYEAVKGIAKEFEDAIDKALANGHAGKRAVVIIDDVDRCFPQSVTGLFTGIKNYLVSEKCVFVLAIVKDKAERAVSGSKMVMSAGDTWLEKLISFEVNLPRPSEETLRNFLKYEIDKFESDSDEWRFVYQLLLDEAVHYVTFVPSNPRKFRRFISDLCFFAVNKFSSPSTKSGLVGLDSFSSEEILSVRICIFLLLLKHFFKDALPIVARTTDYLKSGNVSPRLHEAVERKGNPRADWTDPILLSRLEDAHKVRMSQQSGALASGSMKDVVTNTLNQLHSIGII
ncbi:MAG: hypothetical protein H6508_07130 [Calditrichaeota bacterium]|nr:hypothetical protein [Calditrichota bacterium]